MKAGTYTLVIEQDGAFYQLLYLEDEDGDGSFMFEMAILAEDLP